MPMQTEITFDGVDASEALSADITEHAERLDKFAPDLIKCQVVVRPAERRHHQGNRYAVSLRLTLPGGEIDVGRVPTDGHSHEDPFVAVRDAFRSLQRKLQDFRRKQQGKVKHHESTIFGRVRGVDRESGIGVIEASNGREIRFSRDSVVDGGYDEAQAGDEVRFTEVAADDGPWAGTVHLLGGRRA